MSHRQRGTMGTGLPLHVQAVELPNSGVITIIIKDRSVHIWALGRFRQSSGGMTA